MKNKMILFSLGSALFLFIGCKGDPSTSTKYIYRNNSGTDILLNKISYPFKDTICIKNNEIFLNQRSAEGTGIEQPFTCDSIDVIFANKKHKLYNNDNTSSRNPLYRDNYEKHQISESEYEMHYTFTEQDYLDADSIK